MNLNKRLDIQALNAKDALTLDPLCAQLQLASILFEERKIKSTTEKSLRLSGVTEKHVLDALRCLFQSVRYQDINAAGREECALRKKLPRSIKGWVALIGDMEGESRSPARRKWTRIIVTRALTPAASLLRER